MYLPHDVQNHLTVLINIIVNPPHKIFCHPNKNQRAGNCGGALHILLMFTSAPIPEMFEPFNDKQSLAKTESSPYKAIPCSSLNSPTKTNNIV